ncbi:MAG: PAS domain S-box protein [Nitrospirae bacterium]|nr:MAG: PAS domain S-box protein [Nitrospirota bacterium]
MVETPVISFRGKILVVDDDPDFGLMVTDFLAQEGYTVELVATGASALQIVNQQRFDVVLLDLGLPDIDGLELLKIVTDRDAHLPVILLTAFTPFDREIDQLSLQRAFAYLTKPFNREQLKATIHRAIELQSIAVHAQRLEHKLDASEARYRSLVDAAQDAIIVMNSFGIVLSWNPAARRLFGYEAMEIIGRPLTVIMPARYRDRHIRGLRRLRHAKHLELPATPLEFHGLRKDGTEFPIELTLGSWMTHKGRFFCGIIRDNTARKHQEAALVRRIEMEQLIAECTALFLETSPSDIDAAIRTTLARIGAFAKADRSYLFLMSPQGTECSNTHEWCAPGITPQIHRLQRLSPAQFPWAFTQLKRHEVLHIPRVSELPPEASPERQELEQQSIQSLLVVPMTIQHRLVGFVGFDAVRMERTWLADDIRLLRTISQVMAILLRTGLLDSDRFSGS